MEHGFNSNNASIAWFKLAELITRREREKALNVYRLLAHSLEDRAYALQLEGDILFSLDDKGAIEKYKQAALLYQKEKRYVHAAAVYEHLWNLDQHNHQFLSTLLLFYATIEWQEKFELRLASLYHLFEANIIEKNTLINILKHFIEQLKAFGAPEKTARAIRSIKRTAQACNIYQLFDIDQIV